MRSVRLVLLLDLVAAGLAGGVVLLALGIPLLGGGAPRPGVVLLLACLVVGGVVLVGVPLLLRSAARPIERILTTAARLQGADPRWPVLLPEGEGGSLGRAAIAFERICAALAEERAQLTMKLGELERANLALAEARESSVRAERLAVVGRLASGLAHEVGNPLGAVTGYVELARARLPTGADPELRDALGRIADAAERIDRILRELLDFARPAPARIAAVALAGVVDTAVRLARVQPRFRRVEVVVDVPAALPAVRADEPRLAQVLLNLLLNAADAMGGAGRVEISAVAGPEAVEVTVADSGPGISPEHLPHVFEPFFTTKAPGEGTGLGLATSHRIVEEIGGALTAGAGSQGGAVFRIRLARAAAPAGVAAGPC